MGIKDLWTIFSPFCERKPLYELQGKTVAIDLSCWVCEAQNIAEYVVQPRMYLRNLYFRTCYLLLLDVRPVFVLEGKAPTLKFDTIAARNAIQFKGTRPRKTEPKPGKDRTKFHFTLKLCEEMLGYIGLACIKGNGEAEALCAYLNEDGLVDGCISQDSDCFAYGARIVYRNFSISQQGAHAASGGAVDVYDVHKALESLNFGRNKMVALALLCGCDYVDGVHGIGKDSALKLLNKVSDEEILDRMRMWRTDNVFYDELERKISDKNVCTSCGHCGKLQSHTRAGCLICRTTKGCDNTKFKEERLEIKNELNIRSKALSLPDFPDEELIKEFLVRKDNVSKLDLRWKQPDLIKFVTFAVKYLLWEEKYAFEKFLPILSRWQLLNAKYVEEKFKSHKSQGLLQPDRIKKVRNPKGVPSYELIWKDPENHFKTLLSEEIGLETDSEKFWSTIEPQELVEKAYPDLVDAYKLSKIKLKKPSKRKAKVKDPVDEIEGMLKNTSITETKPKRIRRNLKNNKENEPTKKIDSYFKKALLNNLVEKQQNVLQEQGTVMTSTPSKKHETSACFNFSGLEDDDDLSDLSDIVQDIMKQEPPKYLVQNLEKLGYKLLDKETGRKHEEDKEVAQNISMSSFFMNDPIENDLFEQTFSEMCSKVDNDSGESTEEYEIDEDVLDKCKEAEVQADESDDSFFISNVPLIDRIRSKT